MNQELNTVARGGDFPTGFVHNFCVAGFDAMAWIKQECLRNSLSSDERTIVSNKLSNFLDGADVLAIYPNESDAIEAVKHLCADIVSGKYRRSGDLIVRRLAQPGDFAHNFFTSSEKGYISIYPVIEAVTKDFNRRFGVQYEPLTVASILFEKVYKGGSYRPLLGYSQSSTLFTYIRTITKNAVLEDLDKVGVIAKCGSEVGVISFDGTNYSANHQRAIIAEVLYAYPQLVSLMTKKYVEQLSDDEIAATTSLGLGQVRSMLSQAEKIFVNHLLGDFCYYDFLLVGNNSKRKDSMRRPGAGFTTLSYTLPANVVESDMLDSLYDIFGVNKSDDYAHQHLYENLEQTIDLLGLGDTERRVLLLSIVDGMSSPEIAEELGLSVNTVYNKRHSSFKALSEYVRENYLLSAA